MLGKEILLALVACAATLSNASPLAQRDNDGARPITWNSPGGGQLCWQVDNGQVSANAEIIVAGCANPAAQQFVYNDGATQIRVANTNFCVEFGPGLGRNGQSLRIQNCRNNGAPGQRLFITDDGHISLQNGPGQCADVRDGVGPLQSWRCASDNANQVFFGEVPEPAGSGIGPADRPNLCLQVEGGVWLDFDFDDPGSLEIAPCTDGSDPTTRRFFFDIDGANVTMRDDGSGTTFTLFQDTYDPGPQGANVIILPSETVERILEPSFFVLEAQGTADEFGQTFRLRNVQSNSCVQTTLGLAKTQPCIDGASDQLFSARGLN